MIRTMTAHTSEIDDVESAVSEILRQLGMDDMKLLANTVGILTCYADFIESGTVRGICDALPFDVVGSTTLGNSTRGSIGTMLLTLMVLTSDDVSFSVGLSDPILSENDASLRAAYETTASALPGKPAMIVSFAPLLMNVGGDFYVNSLDAISGGVPNFGMISVDHNPDYHESRVIHNGGAHADRYALILLSGEVKPRFFLGSISAAKVFHDRGAVTSALGNQLQTVNDRPVVEYLKSLGLTLDGSGTVVGINSFPFIVDYNDGTTPVVRAMFANTPEGYAVCGGDIPVGATISVGAIDAGEIKATTSEALESALAGAKPDCILMFSCVGRYFSMGYEPLSEMERVRDIMEGNDVPYQLTYSGGEMCPVGAMDDGASLANRNHNDTFVLCAL
ncbi:MAG: FIST C-terminal domain-containing protein [Synergistaceae bacterium]|jgi:hypothetical protein|nr:FIST C-terminal domain-containing protein [Synergistaceae bacterium]